MPVPDDVAGVLKQTLFQEEDSQCPFSMISLRTKSKAVTRRGFLHGIGAGAAGAAGAVVLPPGALAQQPDALSTPQRVATRPDRFGRMFELRPFAEGTPLVQRSLIEMGAPGGLLDAAGSAARGPGPSHHEPGAQPQEPRQPDEHGRRHLPRPVPGPRHDVRHDVEARRSDAARALAQHADAGAGSGFGLRRRPDRQSAALRSGRPGQVQGARVAASSRTCLARPTAPRSSPTRATTRT